MAWTEARPAICFVTDRRRGDEASFPLLARIRAAAEAGASLVQVRERDLDDRALWTLVQAAVAAVSGHDVRVVVNDRVDVACGEGAHGVHLRSDSVDAARVRAVVPPGFLIGRSVHGVDEAARVAAGGGCDYLVFGTVFPSAGKPDGYPVAGVEGLAAVCRATHLPVLAIGGVGEAGAAEAAAAGAAGVAAIGTFMTAPDAQTLTQRVAAMRRAFDSPPGAKAPAATHGR